MNEATVEDPKQEKPPAEKATTVGCFSEFGRMVGDMARSERIRTPEWLEREFGAAVREKYGAWLERRKAMLAEFGGEG